MVHASMRAVGEVLGGPDVVIDVIMDAIGEAGTMLVYAGCQSPFDDVGRGIYSPLDEEFILEHCPAFDPATARASRDFGVLAEFFRTRPGVSLSGNPGARMAALGAKADWITREHPLNYGLGRGSPLERLCELDGKVALIGSDLDAVTLLHYAEAIAPIENKKLVRLKLPLLVDGRKEIIDIEEFNSSTGIRDWSDRFFAEIVEPFLSTPHAISGPLGNAETHVLMARKLVKYAVPIMVATAQDLDRNATKANSH